MDSKYKNGNFNQVVVQLITKLALSFNKDKWQKYWKKRVKVTKIQKKNFVYIFLFPLFQAELNISIVHLNLKSKSNYS